MTYGTYGFCTKKKYLKKIVKFNFFVQWFISHHTHLKIYLRPTLNVIMVEMNSSLMCTQYCIADMKMYSIEFLRLIIL